MFNSIKQYIKDGFDSGFRLPSVMDGANGKPSVTLWFAHVSFIIACASQVYFIAAGDHLAATLTAIGFWVLAMVFYRLRTLDKVKFDLDDKSFELDGENDNSNTKN